MKINLVVAMDAKNGGIGFQNKIPWHCSEDLKYFKELTSSKKYFKNAIVMGRKTYESIGKPLPNRLNIVLTRNDFYKCPNDPNNEVITVKDSTDAIRYCYEQGVDNLFVIGGYQIYKYFLDFHSNDLNSIYITYVIGVSGNLYDFFFPKIPQCFISQETVKTLKKNNVIEGFVVEYKKSVSEEYQYLNLVEKILKEGTLKPNRTEQSTISIFGHYTKWSLEDNKIPLLTTKKVFTRGLVEELLWFISGSTNSKILENKGINIWKGNTTREFLDKQGLYNLPEGDIGAGYGFQWRHSGANYVDCNTDYDVGGVDQLKDLVCALKTNPNSRRMIMCSWNPSALSKMALPPCHVLFQVYVENGTLHSALYQRSADIGLGVPFNIASYAIFTRILAHCCSLKAGTFHHNTGDTHIYENHIEPLKQQIARIPKEFPKLFINELNKDIFSLKYEDFKIVDYNPHDSIKMDMVV